MYAFNELVEILRALSKTHKRECSAKTKDFLFSLGNLLIRLLVDPVSCFLYVMFSVLTIGQWCKWP